MVKGKEIKLIQDELSRQLSFAKRRNGLIKKALELYMVCAVDCVFISFSPSGRLSFFCGDKRVEEVLARFISLPEHIRRLYLSEAEIQELSVILSELKRDTEEELRDIPAFGIIRGEIIRLKGELESEASNLSKIRQPLPEPVTAPENPNTEGTIEESLTRVQERMKKLAENQENAAFPHSPAPMAGAENEPAIPSDQPHQAEPEGESSDRNQNQMPYLALAADSSRVTFMERSPPQNVFLPNPQNAGPTFSSLLMDPGAPDTLSPIRDPVIQTPAVPLAQPSQAPQQNNISSFQQNQYSNVLQQSLRNNQIYFNGEGSQSTNQHGGPYGALTGNGFPNPNIPSQNYQLPSSLASFQAPYQGQYQPQHSNPVAATPILSPYYQQSAQMPQGGSSSAVQFNGWPNQSTMQPNGPSSAVPRGGFQELLTSVAQVTSVIPPNSGSPSGCFIQPQNLHMNQQAMGGHSMRPNFGLNLQGLLPNPTPQGLQGIQMPAMQGPLDAAGSSLVSHKRKFPGEQDDVAPRLPPNQNMPAAPAPGVSLPTPRPIPNAVYDASYEVMGLPVDPHLRIFERVTKTGKWKAP